MASIDVTPASQSGGSKYATPEDWPTYERAAEGADDGGDHEPYAKNQIWFKVDNQTPFTLNARGETYAYWGNFDSGPTAVAPYTNAPAGHLMSSKSPFTGSLGIIGFNIKGSGNTVHVVLLGSNPYLKADDNNAWLRCYDNTPTIDKDTLNDIYSRKDSTFTIKLDGKDLKISGSIGQADEATATFAFSWG